MGYDEFGRFDETIRVYYILRSGQEIDTLWVSLFKVSQGRRKQ